MKGRILVIGRYINRVTYELRTPYGKYFTTIREGKNYKIGKVVLFPYREPKKNGNGTILSLRRFDKKQGTRYAIPLIHNRLMWWALTENALRKDGLYLSASYLLEKYDDLI